MLLNTRHLVIVETGTAVRDDVLDIIICCRSSLLFGITLKPDIPGHLPGELALVYQAMFSIHSEKGSSSDYPLSHIHSCKNDKYM